MHQLCFTTSLSSSDLAAWVQAIGSVIAIFVAIYLSNMQIKKQYDNSFKLFRFDKQTAQTNTIVSIHAVILMISSLYTAFLQKYSSLESFNNSKSRMTNTFNAVISVDHQIDLLKSFSYQSLPHDVFIRLNVAIKSCDIHTAEFSDIFNHNINISDERFRSLIDATKILITELDELAHEIKISHPTSINDLVELIKSEINA